MSVQEPPAQEQNDESIPAADLLERLVAKLGSSVSASAIYGQPVEWQDVMIIPVAKISFGFGAGAGTGRRRSQVSRGGGGGGGAAAVPLGYIEIKSGKAKFKRRYPSIASALVPIAAFIVGAAALNALHRFRLSSRK